MRDLGEALDAVRRHMDLYYRMSLDDMVISDVPGYWVAREAKIHPGHPLHWCIGNEGPFRTTYTYFDCGRENGRFASPTRTWRLIKDSR